MSGSTRSNAGQRELPHSKAGGKPMTQQISELLDKLKRERFYGAVTLQMRAGQVEIIRKEETIKLKFEGTTSNVHRIQK
jgi:hypothetical protein